jgi:outer membrane protein OmpA-like peptidoglycan-associated protein/uncharacterized protein YidB (DUF937 family)
MQALLESLISETSKQLGAGDQLRRLVSETLKFAFDDAHGGLAGFLQKFRNAGFGAIVDSWVSRGENKSITAQQVDQALIGEPIKRISAAAGLSEEKATSMLAAILPRLVDLVTPEGHVPPVVPREVSRLTGGLFDAWHAPAEFDKQGVDLTKANSWFVPAMLVMVILIIGGIMAFHRADPKQPAKLTVRNNGDIVEYFGLVGDDTTKTTIEETLKTTFGDKLQGSLGLDDTLARPAWLGKLNDVMGIFKMPGSEIDLTGKNVQFGGFLTDADKAKIQGELKNLLPDATITAGGDKVGETVKAAFDRTMNALTALPPGYNAGQIATALNLSVLNFAAGSAELPADAMPLITKAADVLKNGPAGTRIEIAGHTDNQGDTASNLKLSQARAEAVKKALEGKGVPSAMLVAKGYGSTEQRMSNDTEYGRFQNRRIEYKALN